MKARVGRVKLLVDAFCKCLAVVPSKADEHGSGDAKAPVPILA